MGDLADILSNPAQPIPSRPRRQHPDGWEPGVDTAAGTITVRSDTSSAPDGWDDIIRQFGLDPKLWQVVDDRVNVRTWDAALGAGEVRRFFYFRANIAPRRSEDSDVADLIAAIRKHRRRKRPPPPGERALVVCIADLQAGKPDGDGTRGMVDRFLACIDEIEDRVRRYRRDGIQLGSLYIVGLGDWIENCAGWYSTQTFRVELNRRDQRKLVRRLVVKMVSRLAPLFERVVVTGVGGNHGENRKDGKVLTDFADNDDLAVLEEIGEILSANPDVYGHVRTVVPTGPGLTLTLDVCGTIVGFAHGHQARSGGATPSQKVWRWWSGQALGSTPLADADVLVTGHYHTWTAGEEGRRTHFQAPTLDGGSEWWENVHGTGSRPGMLTFVCGPDGWSELHIAGRVTCDR